MKIVSWFSAGVSSALATYYSIKNYQDVEIIYIDIDDQHTDSLRFVKDCETWFNKKIKILRSSYRSVDNACRCFGFINGVGGARCTLTLKKRVRKDWEKENKPTHYVWGFDCSKREKERSHRVIESMPEYQHIFPLIENDKTKEDAHGILKHYGIKRPIMYDLGYPNNNCIGCVKGGMGYWNKIRKDFLEVFNSRVKMERDIGHSCIKGKFLDELKENEGREPDMILEDCGIFCEINDSPTKEE